MTKSKLYSNFAIPDSLNTLKKNFDSRFAGMVLGVGVPAKRNFEVSNRSFQRCKFNGIHHQDSLPTNASFAPIHLHLKQKTSSFNTTNTEASHDSNNDTVSDDSSGDEDDDEVLVEQDKQESSTTKLLPYHAKNYFNSTMGGKDL